MERSPVAVEARGARGRRRILGSVAVALGLIFCTSGPGRSLAEEPFWPRVAPTPTAGSPAVHLGRLVEPASEEVWISSDTPARAASVPGTQLTPQTGPVRPTALKPRSDRLPGPGESSDTLSAMLGPQALNVPMAIPTRSVPSREGGSLGADRNVPAETGAPQSAPAEGRPSLLAARLTQVTSPDRAPESFANAPSTALSTLSERLQAAERDLLEDVNQRRGVPRPTRKEDDGLLFHTTSGPVKPAAFVFRPAPEPKRDEAGAPLEHPDATAQAAKPPEVALPGSVAWGTEPESQRDEAGTPLERPDVTAQATKPPEVPLPGSVPWGKERSSRSILEAQGPKPPEVPLSASLVRSNGPLTPTTLNAGAAKLPRAGAEGSSVRSNVPLAMVRPKTQAIRPPARRRPEPVVPAAPSAGTDFQTAAPKVVLRVRAAEFDRAGARKWGVLRWKFSRRPALLRSLLEEESEGSAILLDSIEAEEIESQFASLEHEGLLRVLGRPTLVTPSGCEARLLTGGDRVRFASSARSHSSATGRDLPGGLRLRPVVLGDDQIELEVVGPRSGLNPQASDAATVARTGSATVRMRAGQTAVISGLGLVDKEAENPRQKTSLAQVLGLEKSSRQPRELVLFVTPELIRSTPLVTMASRPHHAADAEKDPSWLGNWIAGR